MEEEVVKRNLIMRTEEELFMIQSSQSIHYYVYNVKCLFFKYKVSELL